MGLFGGDDTSAPHADLPDRPAPGRECDLFFALMPDADDAHRIDQRSTELRCSLGAREEHVVAADRLHISLHALGRFFDVPAAQIAQARAAGDALQATRQPAIDLVLDEAAGYTGRRACPFVLVGSQHTAALQDLHLRLGIAMADAGLPVTRRFNPHLTLAYLDRAVEPMAIEPLRWTARRLYLIWSHVGRTRYEFVGEWLMGH